MPLNTETKRSTRLASKLPSLTVYHRKCPDTMVISTKTTKTTSDYHKQMSAQQTQSMKRHRTTQTDPFLSFSAQQPLASSEKLLVVFMLTTLDGTGEKRLYYWLEYLQLLLIVNNRIRLPNSRVGADMTFLVSKINILLKLSNDHRFNTNDHRVCL
jgi:hypothetical protein